MLVVPLENRKEMHCMLRRFLRSQTNFLNYDHVQLFGTDVD